MLSVVTKIRTDGASAIFNKKMTGYDYNGGNSYYADIAQKHRETFTDSKPVFKPSETAANAVFAPTFIDDLISGTASFWTTKSTADMVRLINLTTGYKKCLETYFS